MKKTIFITITLLLVAAIAVGVVVYAVGGSKNEDEPVSAAVVDKEAENENVGPDAANEPEPDPAGPVVVTLEEYWAKLKAERVGEPFTLEEIYLLCAELFKTECTIKFTANDCVLYFLGEYSEYGLSAEKMIVTDPANVPEDDVYIVFLASIDLCFDECTNDDGQRAKFFLLNNTNSIWTPDYVFSSNYGDFGYETFSDYYYGRQKEERGIHIYSICFDQKMITYLYTPGVRTNLYEEYKAAAIANGVNIK